MLKLCFHFISYMGLHGFETWLSDDGEQEDSSTSQLNPCAILPGLTAGQRRLCAMYKDHMPAVGSGAKDAIAECQHQFKHRRWNCSTTNNTHVFGPLTKIGEFKIFSSPGVIAIDLL
jgi:hypothetical protein